ncbi:MULTISPECIES: carbohydrate ABC transporter permease [Proteiniclasticum]|uniref:carbohydrate ABC transporter permease n=1 Tax=Proteiniclasticum TaxID=1155385 RepID=UPI00289BD7A0|nr:MULTISPECIES: sugar ABC transporter permease [Proteiniclasticum]
MKKDKKGTLHQRVNRLGWGFVLLSIVSIGVFVFYPMIQSFITSFKSGMGNNLEFNGLDNYKRLLTDQNFRIALKNTLIYLVVQVPIMLLLALVISVMLNSTKLKFRGLFRVAIFLPSITSLVAYSTIFKSLFTNDGLMNKLLLSVGLISEQINWLTDPFWAKITIIIAITWRWTGYNMIFYLAALQNIDTQVYEAAELDGANAIQKFFNITVPLLKPIILFTSITSTIGTLQLFDEVVNITGGGPANATMTLSQYIYNLSFMYTPNFGYAATVSYTIVVLVVGLSLIQLKYGGDKREEN